jgi:CRISPR-associated protein Csm5
MAVYKLNITPVCPLHIGDGVELRQDFDFAIHNDRTYRLDENAILDAKYEQLQLRPGASYPPPGKLLAEKDFENEAFFRYVLPGAPRSAKINSVLRTCIKDVYDRPYIPGSSIKGALRTALAWNGWNEVIQTLDRSSLGNGAKWAAQPLERKLFGRDPNHDLMRALQVSDCQLEGEGWARMMIVNAQVLTNRDPGSPIEVEAVSANQVFTGSLHVDEPLFAISAEQELHFANRKHWLDELMPRANRHSKHRLEKQLAWFAERDSCEGIANFVKRLLDTSLAKNQAFVQLGWGGGWDSKTFGSHLQKDPVLFEQLVRDFRMNKQTRASGARRVGDPFPRSRRVAVRVVDRVAKPAAPFGWVLLELIQTQ